MVTALVLLNVSRDKVNTIAEELAGMDVLCSDKTGTLTEGKPVVRKIEALGTNDNELLAIAAAAVAVVELAHELEQHGNPNLKADAMTAAILAHSSVTVGAMLVQANLTPGKTDARRDDVLRLVRAASASVRRQERGPGGHRARRRCDTRRAARRSRHAGTVPPALAPSTMSRRSVRIGRVIAVNSASREP